MSLKTQFVAYRTIVRKETVRFMRIWMQTLVPPIIVHGLYFIIFGRFIGSQIRPINDISYMAFIVPGIVMMAVINNSFANVVSSFFGNKFQRSIEEILVSPTPNAVILAGYVTGGILRGLCVGVLVFSVSVFFTHPVIHHLGLILIFVLLTSLVFSLGGFLNAVFARSFDDVSIIPTFFLTPLIYLGGVFYSINELPPFWRAVSRFNPILYMVNGFRYGFYGFADVSVQSSLSILLSFAAALILINLVLLQKGTGLKT